MISNYLTLIGHYLVCLRFTDMFFGWNTSGSSVNCFSCSFFFNWNKYNPWFCHNFLLITNKLKRPNHALSNNVFLNLFLEWGEVMSVWNCGVQWAHCLSLSTGRWIWNTDAVVNGVQNWTVMKTYRVSICLPQILHGIAIPQIFRD
jgi:hypothetical protein